MDAQNVHSDKLHLINWITRLQDASIVKELMKIQLRSDENAEIDVPTWHQEKVRSRISTTGKEEYISVDDLDNRISLDQ
ncbi:MAG: hypothetical protein AB8B56_02795 [Crocinitomicaceae bacterium]